MKRLIWIIKELIKFAAIRILSILVRVLYIFPIKKNRIILHSFNGKQYSCNPRAISEYISANYPGCYEIIWAFNEPEKFCFLEKEGIKIVNYHSFKRVFYEATSSISINNCGSYSWIPLRKGQFHINTWHAGGAYKKLQDDVFASLNRKKTGNETSHMISSGQRFTDYMLKQTFDFHGTILEIGMPRNDIFFNKEKMESHSIKVRKYYKVSKEQFLVLYAPTWRFDGNIPCPNFDMIKDAIQQRFKKDAVIMVRNHNYSDNNYLGTINASEYPEMQELLCTADILITDYSSSIWDYSFTYKPCFLYVNDLDKYTKDPGFFTDIHTWGFPVCLNDQQLYDNIISFEEKEFYKQIYEQHQYFGSFETGRATEEFCKIIFGK